MKVLLILLSLFLTTNIAFASKQEWCERAKEDRELHLKYPDMAPYAPPTSGVISPFEAEAPNDSLNSEQTANMLSGYYCDSINNHPLIYASSSGFTVVGVGFKKTYPISMFSAAIKAYEQLLISAGYEIM
jgi:hypothetical protein